jgi:hypothetical protein
VILSDGTVITYDTARQRVRTVETGLRDATAAAVDRTVGRIVLGSETGAVVIDADGEVRRIAATEVVSLGLARDGEILAAVDAAGTVRLWDASTGASMGPLWAGNGAALDSPPHYDADSDTIWVATSGLLLQLPLDRERWIARACDLVGRELTLEEWEANVPGDEPRRSVCG